MDLKKWIKGHEGLRLYPYLCTENKVTIGYGRNIQDNGISADEAEYLLNNDINRCIKELSNFSWYVDSPQHVQYALVNMCFNVGLPSLVKFKKMISAIQDKDYIRASKEALDSKWARQVPNRANEVAKVMRGE